MVQKLPPGGPGGQAPAENARPDRSVWARIPSSPVRLGACDLAYSQEAPESQAGPSSSVSKPLWPRLSLGPLPEGSAHPQLDPEALDHPNLPWETSPEGRDPITA